jgi:hypothetical protein
MSTQMTLGDFRKLSKRDFDNRAVLDEIEKAFEDLEQMIVERADLVKLVASWLPLPLRTRKAGGQ